MEPVTQPLIESPLCGCTTDVTWATLGNTARTIEGQTAVEYE
jgi:hypothetical protein